MAHVDAEMRRKLAAAQALVDTDAGMFLDHASNWNCREAELIASLFDAHSYRATGVELLGYHRDDDEECEGHPEWGVASYASTFTEEAD